MQRQTFVSIWCERFIEAGWLLALSLIPIYFNLLSSRHFEPDKATTLRALVLLMATAAIIYGLERLGTRPATPSDQPVEASNPFAGLWRRFAAVPLAVPALVYVLVFLLATVFSIVPRTSFWGSYQRMQGTYTNLSYIGLFVLLILFLRRREQLERIITVVLLTSLAVSGYGLIQHFQLDPLPWKGDVITRVASTMGNSIFVAAYLIMVVPLALYRIAAALPEFGRAPRATGNSDLLWGVAYTLLVVGTLLLLLSTLMFGAVVRVADFRYWWVFPGAIIVSTALWSLLTLRLSEADRLPAGLIWSAVLTSGYLLLLLLTYAVSAGSGAQVVDTRLTNGLGWGWVMTAAVVLITIFFVMAFMLPRRATVSSRTSILFSILGSGVVMLAALLAIFFSQSRGPWIGAGAGLFVFFSLLLWWAGRQARARDYAALANRLKIALWSWVVVSLAIGAFLIAFNTIDSPFFDQLRNAPYIGRMGKLLETDNGTGLVRRLIWAGDEHAGGAIALITSNPVRTIIGWGPESMFVAYNPFYPPALANIESRGASPDRSHQAILDELVNKGVLGLLSYLFLLFSFVVLVWNMLWRSDEWRWQVFFIACLSIIVCNFVEGLTGIPIVSTLMMFWVTLAMTVLGGALAGHYALGAAPVARAELVEEPVAATPQPAAQGKGKKRGQQRGAVARGAATARGTGRRQQTNPAALAVYSILLVLALGGVWWFNINPVYADMRFQEAQNYSDASNAGIGEQIVGLDKYLDAIRRDPDEDFYYLSLGRAMMNIADYRRSQFQSQGQPLTPPDGSANLNELLALDSTDSIQQFISTKTPLTIMSYAELVLRRAQQLNPLNKDHSANLARLNTFWYNWTQDPSRLKESVDWYARATELAPQDVSIANEYASTVALLGNYTAQQGDATGAQGYYTQAEQILAHSKELDPKYKDTDGRLADIYRLQGRYDEATAQYVANIAISPHQFDQNIERIIADYTKNNKTDQLKQILKAYMDASAKAPQDGLLASVAGLVAVRSGDLNSAVTAYGTAVQSAPQRLDYLRNYTLVLSDTSRYAEALKAGEQAVAIAQQQVQSGQTQQSEADLLQALVAYLQQKASGG